MVVSYDYDSFGNLKRHGHKVKQPYTFTGREWDREIGLYYYRARYYDANTGRFTTFDPILRGVQHTESNSCSPAVDALPLQSPQELNPYAYVRNNPLTFVDPTGLIPEENCFSRCMLTSTFYAQYQQRMALCNQLHASCLASIGQHPLGRIVCTGSNIYCRARVFYYYERALIECRKQCPEEPTNCPR